jgi:hypothetical protein
VQYGTREAESAFFCSKTPGVVVPEDEEDGVITEVPLFDLTHAPRMSGSGPGLLRSVIEKDFERGLSTGLALFELAAPLELSSPFLRAFLSDGDNDDDDGTFSVNCAVEDNRLSSCSSACTASAAAASESLSNERLDSAWAFVSLERACERI